MSLPLLLPNEPPIRHADCCLSLSRKLLEVLTNIISKKCSAIRKQTVLSVGSGTGLLEALLLKHIDSQPNDHKGNHLENLSIEGVEVEPPVSKPHLNKYLPEHASSTVRGTWELSPRIRDEDVSAIIFTYPRQKALVSRYVQAAAQPDSGIDLVVWLGPAADWDEFNPCFQQDAELGEGRFVLEELLKGDEAGIGEYEMMAMFGR